MARDSAILGVVGGAGGLLMFGRLILYPFASQAGLSGIDSGIQLLNFAVYFAGVGALFGVLGGLVSIRQSKAGGAVLSIGFATVSFGWAFGLAEALSRGLNFNFFFLVISISFLWWSGLILLGALMAFHKTREILRKSWEPLPQATLAEAP